MFEFTLGGAAFRWSALDRRSKLLAGASFATAALAGGAGGIVAKPINPRFGYDLTAHVVPLALLCVAAALASAWLWYKFSRRQDEMFNHVQNWTLGMSGAWTCVLATTWMLLAKAALLPPISGPAIASVFALLACLFWFVAVRRWAF